MGHLLIIKAMGLMLGLFVVSGNHHQHGNCAVLIGQHVKLMINTFSFMPSLGLSILSFNTACWDDLSAPPDPFQPCQTRLLPLCPGTHPHLSPLPAGFCSSLADAPAHASLAPCEGSATPSAWLTALLIYCCNCSHACLSRRWQDR